MRNLISIDPGLRGVGLAAWHDRELASARYVVEAQQRTQPHDALHMVHCVREAAFDAVKGPRMALPTIVVIEKPKVYATQHQKGDQRDLIDLAVLIGAVVSVLAPIADRVELVEPWQWKGQAPKQVIASRAAAALGEEELARVELPSLSRAHNVWDAVGIGLWRLGRDKAPLRAVGGAR